MTIVYYNEHWQSFENNFFIHFLTLKSQTIWLLSLKTTNLLLLCNEIIRLRAKNILFHCHCPIELDLYWRQTLLYKDPSFELYYLWTVLIKADNKIRYRLNTCLCRHRDGLCIHTIYYLEYHFMLFVFNIWYIVCYQPIIDFNIW